MPPVPERTSCTADTNSCVSQVPVKSHVARLPVRHKLDQRRATPLLWNGPLLLV